MQSKYIYTYIYLLTLPHEHVVLQWQSLKRTLTGLNSEFSFYYIVLYSPFINLKGLLF